MLSFSHSVSLSLSFFLTRSLTLPLFLSPIVPSHPLCHNGRCGTRSWPSNAAHASLAASLKVILVFPLTRSLYSTHRIHVTHYSTHPNHFTLPPPPPKKKPKKNKQKKLYITSKTKNQTILTTRGFLGSVVVGGSTRVGSLLVPNHQPPPTPVQHQNIPTHLPFSIARSVALSLFFGARSSDDDDDIVRVC